MIGRRAVPLRYLSFLSEVHVVLTSAGSAYMAEGPRRIKRHTQRTLCWAVALTGQLADTPSRGLPTRGLDFSRTGQLEDWTSRGLDNSRSRRCRQKNEN